MHTVHEARAPEDPHTAAHVVRDPCSLTPTLADVWWLGEREDATAMDRESGLIHATQYSIDAVEYSNSIIRVYEKCSACLSCTRDVAEGEEIFASRGLIWWLGYDNGLQFEDAVVRRLRRIKDRERARFYEKHLIGCEAITPDSVISSVRTDETASSASQRAARSSKKLPSLKSARASLS